MCSEKHIIQPCVFWLNWCKIALPLFNFVAKDKAKEIQEYKNDDRRIQKYSHTKIKTQAPIQASVFNIFQDVKYTKNNGSKKDFSNNNNKSNKLWQQMDI